MTSSASYASSASLSQATSPGATGTGKAPGSAHVADCVAVVGAACSRGSAGGGDASADAVAAPAVEGGTPAGGGALAQAAANRAKPCSKTMQLVFFTLCILRRIRLRRASAAPLGV